MKKERDINVSNKKFNDHPPKRPERVSQRSLTQSRETRSLLSVRRAMASTLLKLLLDERLVSSYVSYSGQIDVPIRCRLPAPAVAFRKMPN